MSRDCFWLTKDQFAVLKPLLPNDTRGKPRVDDQRVISGIIQVRSPVGAGPCAGGLWSAQNTLQSLRPLGSEGRMGRHIPGTRNGRRTSGAGPDR